MYYAFFHLTTGRDIRFPMPLDDKLEDIQDTLASEIVSRDFWHFMDNGKLMIINMRQVAFVKIVKV